MIKHFVAGIGIVIVIIGWLISNADHFPFVYRIIAPNYTNSISALDRMRQKNYFLKKGDTGFTEISGILEKFITGEITPIITEIKTLNWEKRLALMRTAEGAEWSNYYIELEISFSNGKPVTEGFWNLELLVKEKYLSNEFLYSILVFWIGIVISMIGFVLEIFAVKVKSCKKD